MDRIRDARLSFDEMLDRVLHELRLVILADMSFIMLYDRAGKQLELRATSQEDLASRWSSTHQIETAATEAVAEGELVMREDLEGAYGSVMCVPLIPRETRDRAMPRRVRRTKRSHEINVPWSAAEDQKVNNCTVDEVFGEHDGNTAAGDPILERMYTDTPSPSTYVGGAGGLPIPQANRSICIPLGITLKSTNPNVS